MNELTVVDRTGEWRRMKSLVLDSVSSPITKRVYNMALDEFFSWYAQEPRPGFTKATVSAWRVTLEPGCAPRGLLRGLLSTALGNAHLADPGLLAGVHIGGTVKAPIGCTLGFPDARLVRPRRGLESVLIGSPCRCQES